MKKKWTNDEIFFLKENYPEKKIKELAVELNRSFDSVATQLYSLGLTQEKKYWSKSEMDFIKENFEEMSVSDISLKIGRSEKSIKRIITEFNIRNLMEDFDTNIIEKNIKLKINTKSVQYRLLLSKMEVGDSFEFPDYEKAILNNQFKYFPEKKFITRFSQYKARRVWRII